MKSFVSEQTSAELVRLEKDYEETEKELESLQEKYKGSTPVMRETLNILMKMDLHYQAQVRTLVSKLEYIKAAYAETRYKADKEQARGEKCYYDALMDMMDD